MDYYANRLFHGLSLTNHNSNTDDDTDSTYGDYGDIDKYVSDVGESDYDGDKDNDSDSDDEHNM